MHCTDDELLAHLDGELSSLHSGRVSSHLKSCWSCRTRLAQHEHEIHRLTQAMDEWNFPVWGWQEDAKQRLNEKMRAFEVQHAAAPLRRTPFRWVVLAYVAAAALLLPAGIGAFLWTRSPRVTPNEAIRGAARFERALYFKPVRQEFSVQIVQIRPAGSTRTSQLQIWSDGADGQFVSRFSDANGSLKQALWRDAPSSEYIYRPSSAANARREQRHRVEDESLTDLAAGGLEPAQIEASFLRWLERRSWRPISFASGVSNWVSADGTTAHAEQILGSKNERMIRVTAERRSRRLVAILNVELDAGSYRPRLQKIRFETPEHTVELSLTALAVNSVSSRDVAAAVQSADPVRVALAHPTITFAPPKPHKLQAPVPVPAPSTDTESDSIQVTAHYVLHLAGACLGEAVRVTGESGGARVWRLGSGVSSVESNGVFAETGLGDVLNVLSVMRGSPAASASSGGSGTTVPIIVRHAAALHFLAAQFPALRTPTMPIHSRQLISSMVHDHAFAIRRELERAGKPVPAQTLAAGATSNWQQVAETLYSGLAAPISANTPLGLSEAGIELATKSIPLLERYGSSTPRNRQRATSRALK
ncbi:MAG: hypothetical protein IT161_01330 [Bryobacterales bacterium]|nr:hypothetical protein [Bryobacterales bacterium]